MWTRLASNSQSSAFLCLLSAEIKSTSDMLGFRGQLAEVSSHFTMWVQGLNSAQSHLAPSAFIHRAMSLATVPKKEREGGREGSVCMSGFECILLHARVHIVEVKTTSGARPCLLRCLNRVSCSCSRELG